MFPGCEERHGFVLLQNDSDLSINLSTFKGLRTRFCSVLHQLVSCRPVRMPSTHHLAAGLEVLSAQKWVFPCVCYSEYKFNNMGG